MKKVFTLLLVLIATIAVAQDKLNTELNFYTGRVRYNDTVGRIRQFDFKISSPVYQNEKSRLSASFSYNSEALSNFPSNYGTNVQGIGIGLNWSKIISARNVLSLFGQTGIYSDMDNVSSNAIRERLGFTYLTKHSDTFTFGFGLAYTKQFYGNQVIPIIVIIYHFDNEHWKLSGAIPESPKLSYNLGKVSAISLQLKDAFSSYRLTAKQDSDSYIKTTKLTSIVNYEYYIAKSWRISAGVGYALHQRYELYKDTDAGGWYFIGSALGTKPQPVNVIAHNGAEFHIGLQFNPPF